MKTELILITMENGDEIKAELYPETAPKTVENFLKLVDEKFYDGLTVLYHASRCSSSRWTIRSFWKSD